MTTLAISDTLSPVPPTHTHLFLDDIRDPHQVTWVKLPWFPGINWIVVRSYNAFISHIQTHGVPTFVTFDHDLAIEHYLPETDSSEYTEKTGRDCAVWLAEHCLDTGTPIPEYAVHSMNPVGRDNIVSVMESARRVEMMSLEAPKDQP